jgi:hypothetical protein
MTEHDKIPPPDDNAETKNDHSLREKSWKRATGEAVPKTLTPYEWLEYYKQYGIPESHRGGPDQEHKRPEGLVKRLKHWLKNR